MTSRDGPGHVHGSLVAAKRDMLLLVARQFAWGIASEDDVVDAAEAYGVALNEKLGAPNE